MNREDVIELMRGNINHRDFLLYKKTNQLIDFKYFTPFFNLETHAIQILLYFIIQYDKELDNMIEQQLILHNISHDNIYNITPEFFYKMLIKNINLFSSLNPNDVTDEITKIAITNDCSSLKYVENLTEELCKFAVMTNIKASLYVPEKYSKIFLPLIEKNHFLILETPSYYRTYENYLIVVKNMVKDEKMNKEIFKKAILEFPINILKNELAKIIVSYDSSLFEKILNTYKTPELCMMAVKDNGYLIRFVPEKKFTYELCEIAENSNFNFLGFIPKESIDRKICIIAINNCPNAIGSVPKNLLDEEMCEIAVKKDPVAFCYVPNEFKTDKLCDLALESSTYVINCFPKHKQTNELYEKIVRKNGFDIIYIPSEFKTMRIYELAIEENPLSLMNIENNLDDALYLKAVSINGLALEFIPESRKTDKICDVAIKQNKLAECFRPTK